MLRLPAVASDDGDVEEVLARGVGEPIDDGDELVEADDFDSAPAFLHQLAKAWLEALPKGAEVGPDGGDGCRRQEHGRCAIRVRDRQWDTFRNQLQQESHHPEPTLRQEAEVEEVPTVDEDAVTVADRENPRRAPQTGTLARFQALDQPVGEERCEGLEEPLAQPDVSAVGAAVRRLPSDFIRQRCYGTRLEQEEMALTVNRPLDVLRGAEMLGHRLCERGNAECCLAVDSPLGCRAAGCLA